MSADTGDQAADFQQIREGLIGRATSDKPARAPDEVNLPMIRHWVDALGDKNPVYTDEEFAATTRFGGVVAPPTMLQIWTMGRPTLEGLVERGGIPADVGESPMSAIDKAGFTATIATNSELEFDRYLRPGERLLSHAFIEDISDEKKTSLGVGHFVTWVTTYETESGEVVGRQRFRVLKFKPEAAA